MSQPAERYAFNQTHCAELIAEIQSLLAKHAAKPERKHWGDVGDIAEVGELLEAVRDYLAPGDLEVPKAE